MGSGDESFWRWYIWVKRRGQLPPQGTLPPSHSVNASQAGSHGPGGSVKVAGFQQFHGTTADAGDARPPVAVFDTFEVPSAKVPLPKFSTDQAPFPHKFPHGLNKKDPFSLWRRGPSRYKPQDAFDPFQEWRNPNVDNPAEGFEPPMFGVGQPPFALAASSDGSKGPSKSQGQHPPQQSLQFVGSSDYPGSEYSGKVDGYPPPAPVRRHPEKLMAGPPLHHSAQDDVGYAGYPTASGCPGPSGYPGSELGPSDLGGPPRGTLRAGSRSTQVCGPGLRPDFPGAGGNWRCEDTTGKSQQESGIADTILSWFGGGPTSSSSPPPLPPQTLGPGPGLPPSSTLGPSRPPPGGTLAAGSRAPPLRTLATGSRPALSPPSGILRSTPSSTIRRQQIAPTPPSGTLRRAGGYPQPERGFAPPSGTIRSSAPGCSQRMVCAPGVFGR
eukprot:TRINITY_DN27441_c0_g1_i1.p1 TRINITY_DN27441_c0_g1~~TRINITY_DN27441_c0_g1_i1.p1  ORF type:complete len:440 (-),score=79.83 TRINITY_DN27441_c0_g1_i1:107-1426(-)